MSQAKKKETKEPEKDSGLEALDKLGLAFGTLEKRALKEHKKDRDSKNQDYIKKANEEKEKEKIQESEETKEIIFDINEELVGTLFIPIDLFLNDNLEKRGITPFTEKEIKLLFDLILKLMPKEFIAKITETTKKTKKISWFKKIDKILALLKHLYSMTAVRYKQYSIWKESQPKKSEIE